MIDESAPENHIITAPVIRVTLLGTGGPRPDPTRQGPAVLVQVGGHDLVFDAGRGVASQLVKVGVGMAEIDAVFITHHHFDHIGGLGDLIMAAWNNGRSRVLPVHGPPGTAEIVAALLDGVYRRDVDYRLAEERALGRTAASPMAMVEVHERMGGVVELGANVRVMVGEVEHGGSVLGLPTEQWATVGYRISSEGKHVAISGDAVAGKDLGRLAARADVLVMCAYLAAGEISSTVERFLVENVLAGAPQAAAIAADASVRTLVLTHIREKSQGALGEMADQVRSVFRGEVILGRDLLAIDV